MPTASPWIKQGAFPSCTRAPLKHSAVLSSLEQMGPIKVLASSTTSAEYPSTGTKSGEKNKPQQGSLSTVLKMQFETCCGAGLALCSHLGGGNGRKIPAPHPSHKDIVSVPRESQLPELWAAFWFTFFGRPVPAFPCLLFYTCSSSTLHTRIKTFHKWLRWKGGLIGEETETSQEGVFCRKFREEIGLGHGCPYSAACFLPKTLLSSASQM